LRNSVSLLIFINIKRETEFTAITAVSLLFVYSFRGLWRGVIQKRVSRQTSCIKRGPNYSDLGEGLEAFPGMEPVLKS
jgi:hypothetical protein